MLIRHLVSKIPGRNLYAQGRVAKRECQGFSSFAANPELPSRRLNLGALGEIQGLQPLADKVELD